MRQKAKYGKCEVCQCAVDITADRCQMHLPNRLAAKVEKVEILVSSEASDREQRIDLAEELMLATIQKVDLLLRRETHTLNSPKA